MAMAVVSGSNSKALAQELAQHLNWEYHPMEARRFPDSEGYIRIPEDSIEAVRGEFVVLVSSTFPDSGIIETLLLLEAISDVRSGNTNSLQHSHKKEYPPIQGGIILAIPYFGYSRQDKRFKMGEVVSAKSIGRMLSQKCDGIVVLDLHAPEALADMEIPISYASAMPEIADHLKSQVNPDFILSPDKGAVERASEVARFMNCEFSYLEKTRLDAHTIVHQAKDLDVQGKVVTIVDDMIATGGTICRATEALKQQGATEVHAACTHGLFTGGAINRLKLFVDGIHATSSLPNPRAVVNGGPALARGVAELLDIFSNQTHP